ncbi:MAG: outer membrane beta-barrel protein [Rickettsiales bacterium]|nr:outer membrane beta-barrel protein [Rickettsiales bacterium]
MKKIIAITAVAVSMLTSSALAKTEGNYASANLLYNRTSFNYQNESNKTSNGAGIGFGYKYAFNFDKIFIAPGVFVEKNNINSDVGPDKINIKNRYGFKADLGYDLEDNLSVYLVGGLSFLNYRTSSEFDGSLSNRSKSSLFYGAGISHDYSKNISFSLEYNTQSLSLKDRAGDKIKTDNNTVKIGLNYKF